MLMSQKSVAGTFECVMLLDGMDEEIEENRCCRRRWMSTEPKRVPVALAVLASCVLLAAHGARTRRIPGETTTSLSSSKARVDIVHVVLDDVGMNDIWGSSDLPAGVTPKLHALRDRGVLLSNYYGQAFCTPARAALFSGMFVHRLGFGGSDVLGAVDLEISAWANFSLPPSVKLLPEYMKEAGYSTHGVGKWNLGHCDETLLPTNRGFDTFLGYYGAGISYESHLVEYTPTCPNSFEYDGHTYDLYDMASCDAAGCSPAPESTGVYSTELFTTRAVRHVEEAARPTYVYVAYHGVHDDSGVADTVIPASVRELIDKATEGYSRRRDFAFGLYAADHGIGRIHEALERHSDNYVLVVHSDNGGSPCGTYCDSNNWPLRGFKFHDFEGGVKVPAMIFANKLIPSDRRGSDYVGLMHHVDWMATLGRIAGRPCSSECDSLNHWDAILGESQPYDIRDTIFFSLDADYASVRHREFKLMYQRSNASWWNVSEETEDVNLCLSDTYENFLFDVVGDPHERHNLYYRQSFSTTRTKLEDLWHTNWDDGGLSGIVPPGFTSDSNITKAAFAASLPNATGSARFVVPWGCALPRR